MNVIRYKRAERINVHTSYNTKKNKLIPAVEIKLSFSFGSKLLKVRFPILICFSTNAIRSETHKTIATNDAIPNKITLNDLELNRETEKKISPKLN